MPKWIHDRAKHIQAKNPDMDESTAFAIATQQAHSLGKSPKGYGTAKGKEEAKEKYKTPSDDVKTANPSKKKEAGFLGAIAPIVTQDQDARMRQIIREELQASQVKPPGKKRQNIKTATLRNIAGSFLKQSQLTLSSVAAKPTIPGAIKAPRGTLTGGVPKQYTQVNAANAPGPSQTLQPVLNPPPVRG